MLPDEVPATVNHYNRQFNEEYRIKIRYSIYVAMVERYYKNGYEVYFYPCQPVMQQKLQFLVQPDLDKLIDGNDSGSMVSIQEKLLNTMPVTSFCFNKGQVSFGVQLNRCVVYSREPLEAILTIDNKFCKARLKECIFSVQQRLTIHNGNDSDGKRVFKRYVYKETKELNIKPEEEQRVLKKVILELNLCRYPYNKTKINKND